MNTNSNSYTIIYASVMVVIVAFLLAFVNSSLRDLQGKNVELDTKKQILSSLGITEVKDADAEFSKACTTFEASKTLPASIIARVKNECGYEIVK